MFRKNKKCYQCFFSECHMGKSVGTWGYVCRLNPLKPIDMGLIGECSERKKNKEEQYPKKDS